jgi:hypothetical protein
MSRWIPLALVIDVIEAAKRGDWCWSGNSQCKYIDLRIDMRDRGCLLKDRDGNEITIDDLRQQSGTVRGCWSDQANKVNG